MPHCGQDLAKTCVDGGGNRQKERICFERIEGEVLNERHEGDFVGKRRVFGVERGGIAEIGGDGVAVIFGGIAAQTAEQKESFFEVIGVFIHVRRHLFMSGATTHSGT